MGLLTSLFLQAAVRGFDKHKVRPGPLSKGHIPKTAILKKETGREVRRIEGKKKDKGESWRKQKEERKGKRGEREGRKER